MDKEEKRRKFHQLLLSKLYPPSPPSLSHQNVDKEVEEQELADLDLIKDGFHDYSSSLEEKSTSSDTSECEQQKMTLTRAQRKRLRKKKLKEAASCRRKIIGPLLPEAERGRDCDDLKDDKMLNEDSTSAIQHLNSLVDKPGELSSSCATQKKLKHRRMAKRLKLNNVGTATGHDDDDEAGEKKAMNPLKNG